MPYQEQFPRKRGSKLGKRCLKIYMETLDVSHSTGWVVALELIGSRGNSRNTNQTANIRKTKRISNGPFRSNVIESLKFAATLVYRRLMPRFKN